MLTKFKNWCSKPVTWGGYWKLAGVSVLLSLGYSIALMAKYGLLDAWIESLKMLNPFRRKGYDTEEES